ncbi:MAG: alpha/beta hydrolase [Candidatus Methylacidiphilales bacterium]
MLHGTGGTELDLLPLGRSLASDAALLSPRGKILEQGMPRFFRRMAEGVFDEEDLIYRTHELADFIVGAAAEYGLDAGKVYAVGYSNGANIAGALLLLRPEVLAGAALIRPMVPLVPDTLPDLKGKPVLLAAAHQDSIVPGENTRRLAALLKSAGAEVTVRFENAGHNLTTYTVETTRRWLAERR